MGWSVIIPTYQRPGALSRCVQCMVAQTLSPQEIILIDDDKLSDASVAALRNVIEGQNIKFIYRRKNPLQERRGLAESKNIALDLASEGLVLIIDDDIYLEPDFLEQMDKAWLMSNIPGLIGIGGILTNGRVKPWFEKIYNTLFWLASEYRWDVNEVGFQVWDESIGKREKGFYTHGGLCTFRTDLARKLRFTTFSGGRTALEDVDFCLRAKNAGFHFYIEPKAKAFHDHAPGARESEMMIGKKESLNRRLIFRAECKHDAFHRVWFAWASIGWIVRQFLAGHFSRGMGMIQGSFYRIGRKV